MHLSYGVHINAVPLPPRNTRLMLWLFSLQIVARFGDGCSSTFSRWDLFGKNRSLGIGFLGYLVSCPFPVSHSHFPFGHEETSCLLLGNFVPITFLPLSAWDLTTRDWINPPKTRAKICNSSFKLLLSGTLVIMVIKVTKWYSPRIVNIDGGLHLQKPKGRQECYVYCGAGNGRVFRQNVLKSSWLARRLLEQQ